MTTGTKKKGQTYKTFFLTYSKFIKYMYFHNLNIKLSYFAAWGINLTLIGIFISQAQAVQSISKHRATSFRYSIEGHLCFLNQVLNYYNESKTYCDVNALTVTLTGIAATGWFIGPESTTHTFNSGTLLRRRGREQRQLIWMTK